MKAVRETLLKALHRERYSWFMVAGTAVLIVAVIVAR
jgi:hypothetical protein